MQNTCLNNKKKCVGDNEATYQLFFLSTKTYFYQICTKCSWHQKKGNKIKLHEDFLARYFWVMLRDSVCDHAAIV